MTKPLHDGIANRAAQVIRHGDGADLSVVHLQPFVTEDHPWLAFLVHIEGAVQTLPAGRRDGLLLHGLEGAQRIVRDQALAAPEGALCPEGGDDVILTLPHVAFRSPVVQGGPEAGLLRVENLNGGGPVDQILAHQGVEDAAAPLVRETLQVEKGRIEVILAAHRVGKNVGIGDVDVMYVEGIVHVQGLRFNEFCV